MVGSCRACRDVEPLNADWLCEGCADERRQEQAELDRDYADPYDDEDDPYDWDD